jgi:hypothetical protein
MVKEQQMAGLILKRLDNYCLRTVDMCKWLRSNIHDLLKQSSSIVNWCDGAIETIEALGIAAYPSSHGVLRSIIKYLPTLIPSSIVQPVHSLYVVNKYLVLKLQDR